MKLPILHVWYMDFNVIKEQEIRAGNKGWHSYKSIEAGIQGLKLEKEGWSRLHGLKQVNKGWNRYESVGLFKQRLEHV